MKITIGGFDGMHIAHQELIKKADFILIIEKGSNLTPGLDRCEYTTLPCQFFELQKIKHLSADKFIDILKNLGAKQIIIGEDFRFGNKREGNINLLKKHFKVEIIKEIKLDGVGVHSHIIRDFIRYGNIKKANRFLGHTYKIKGVKIKGQGIGSRDFVPTINIELLKNYILPKTGVYLTKTNSHPSITFIGTRSTDNNFAIETHIFDKYIPEDLIKIEFLDFLRENKIFKNFEDLKTQIQNDLKTAKKIFL